MAPFGWDLRVASLPLFLSVLLEKLSAKERQDLFSATALDKEEISAWQKLEAAAKKLDKELKGPKLQKPSQLYKVIVKTPGEQIMHLAVYSAQRIVQMVGLVLILGVFLLVTYQDIARMAGY